MTEWRPDKNALKRPAYLALVDQVSKAIQQGQVEPGEQLPPQRELAEELGISLQTVSRAYEELRRRDLVLGEIGRGTFVQAPSPTETTPFREYRLSGSVVDLSIFKPVTAPLHKECMSEALARLSKDIPEDTLFSFRPNQGLPRHVKTAELWLDKCGVTAEDDRIVITNGVTQGTMAAMTTVCKAGDTVVAPEVGHHSLPNLCSYLGLRLKGLALDEDGILPDAFAKACKEGGVKALYIMPNLANPTATLMSEARRKALVEIARAHDIFIIENDVLGPLPMKTPPPMAALAPERTFYLTSFTKVLMPGLRSGYMVIPAGMLPSVRNRLLATAWMATPMMAEIAARWVEDGTAQKLVNWQRKALGKRLLLVSKALHSFQYNSHPCAMHIWLPLPGRWRSSAFVTQAQKLGVAVAPSAPFVVNLDIDLRAVRVSLGSAPEAEFKRGLRILAQLLDREPEILVGGM